MRNGGKQVRMRSGWCVAVVIGLISATALAKPPADPVAVDSPRAGESVEIGNGSLTLKPVPYTNATKYQCTLTQGSVKWDSGPQPYPICKVDEAAQAKFKAGPAEVAVKVFAQKHWLPAASVSVTLKTKAASAASTSSGSALPTGATTKNVTWDDTWSASSGGGTAMTCPTGSVTVKNNKLTFDFSNTESGDKGHVEAQIDTNGHVDASGTYGSTKTPWKLTGQFVKKAGKEKPTNGEGNVKGKEADITMTMGENGGGNAKRLPPNVGRCNFTIHASDWELLGKFCSRATFSCSTDEGCCSKKCVNNECL